MLQLRVKLEYNTQEKLSKLTIEERKNIRDNILALKNISEPQERSYKNSAGEDVIYFSLSYPDEIIISEIELDILKKHHIDFQIKDFKQTYKTTDSQGNNYNFHLPNLGLLEVRYVTWLEDSCTEILQQHLDKGWKIIAVCPPNGTRRPDYILGSNTKII